MVDGLDIDLYLDGVLQLGLHEPTAKDVFQVVTRDEETGDSCSRS